MKGTRCIRTNKNELNKIETEQEALKNKLETKSNSLNIC